MKSARKATKSPKQQTFPVSQEVFQMVYEAPSSLPGKHKWVTTEADVRQIERVLGMPAKTIGAPLWVSGNQPNCPTCQREINWLDIVTSATKQMHRSDMLARVILGQQKYVNTEAPRAIADLHCVNCGTTITGLRSFKCHNWAYAIGKMRQVILAMNRVKADQQGRQTDGGHGGSL